jgi:osmotically-inducible protein OsmY
MHAPGSSAGYDTDIAQAASQLLSWAVDVPSNTVTFEVHNHVITLSGHVTWNYQREAAARAVMYIHGVTAVANNITLARRPVSAMQDAAE